MENKEILEIITELQKIIKGAFIFPPFGKFTSRKKVKDQLEKIKELNNEDLSAIVREIEVILEFSFIIPLFGININEIEPKVQELKNKIGEKQEV